MAELTGEVMAVKMLTEQNRQDMFRLMAEFYQDTEWSVFLRDLAEKQYCILLFDAEHRLRGFSTQQILQFDVAGEAITGVFSGDTIIHRECWGSMELYRVFARYFMDFGKRYGTFYWFLITKGYKTYKMLPLFFKDYYPSYKGATPDFEQQIMEGYGRLKYPEEYDPQSGLILYRGKKDKLKPGVADITEKQLRDADIRYFLRRNPEYYAGYDLVCLARFTEDNLRPGVQRLILGK